MVTPTGLTAYITNAQDNAPTPGTGSVITVDLTGKKSPTSIKVAKGTNAIIVTRNGAVAFVTNEYAGSLRGSVSRIDLSSSKVVGEPIPVGSEPVDIEVVPHTGETWAWVANYGNKTITTVNLATGKVGDTIPVPEAGPNTVAFTPDGRTCFVANWGTNDCAGSTVTPIQVTNSGASGSVLKSIDVGYNPNWVAITKDGATAYVANKGSNSITPIDVRTNKAGAPLIMPGPPIQIAISPDGTLAYVAIAGGSIDAVVILDLRSTPALVGGTIKLPSGTQPHWIAFTPDGATAYAVGNGNRTLTPITVLSGTAGTPIQVSNDVVADILDIVIVATTKAPA